MLHFTYQDASDLAMWSSKSGALIHHEGLAVSLNLVQRPILEAPLKCRALIN